MTQRQGCPTNQNTCLDGCYSATAVSSRVDEQRTFPS